MAGTDGSALGADGADTATDDDALAVLTAVLLTPGRFPGVLGDDYPQACAALGLDPVAGGYGLVFGQDGGGARWTVVVDDVPLVATAIASWDCGMEYDLSPDEGSMVVALPGWPLSVAVKAPGLPTPHDPDPREAGPALVPPDTTGWGAAQRRLGADEIAAHWGHWRTQLGDDAFAAAPAGEDRAAGGGPAHEGVRRVLAETRGYLASPPPPGRIRTFFAGENARTVRADGPGWSLVARTDDIAFVLLDDEPGEIIPVGRGPELPGLLEGLAALAVDPL
jgi:hypothetical protein